MLCVSRVALTFVGLFLVMLAVIPMWLSPSVTNGIVLASVLMVPLGLLSLARRRLTPWSTIIVGFLVAAPVLAYLAHDDAELRRPLRDPVAFEGAEKSFEVLMRYGKNHSLGRDFRAPPRNYQPRPNWDPSKVDAWAVWLLANRELIEADWADLAPLGKWWGELATFERIADLTASDHNAELIAYPPLRTYVQRACAIAALQALDGRGDEAFTILQPVLDVSRRLEPESRTLMRFVISLAMQKLAVDTATFILDHATVSPAARVRFAAALTRGIGGEAGARRFAEMEYSIAVGSYRNLQGWDYFPFDPGNDTVVGVLANDIPKPFLSLLTRLVCNPARTFNAYGDYTQRLQDMVARRELNSVAPLRDELVRPRFKNLLGTLFIAAIVPAYPKLADNYWKNEDARMLLLKRLETV